VDLPRYFDIPEPCDADFDEMRKVGPHARRCARCATVVHDVGSMADADASALISIARVASVCVRTPVRSPRARLAVLAPLVLSACGSSESYVVGKVSVPDDSAVVAPSPSASANPSAASTPGPRAWDIERGSLRMHIVDKPGMLVDGNAPPPPPGQPLSPHPFLSGSCNNDVMGCSEAGNVLRDSKSTDEFISRLAKAGFIVKPAPP
jgi:hypothetical protein